MATLTKAGSMHDHTRKNLYRTALLSLRRLHRRFQHLREHGKVSVEAAQCVSDALSCLRRSNDLYKSGSLQLSATTPPAKTTKLRKKSPR
jgi:hypothetical protein